MRLAVMLAYLAGLLYLFTANGLEAVFQLCYIALLLQAMLQGPLLRLAEQPAIPQENNVDLEAGNISRRSSLEVGLMETMRMQPIVVRENIDLEAGDVPRIYVLEVRRFENMETQEQQRMERLDQQTQTSGQIPPSPPTQQDDDQKECMKMVLKVSIGIGGIIGSMIAVVAGNEPKKPDGVFFKVRNLLLWTSFVLSVILMVLALASMKIKQIAVFVKIAMCLTIVSLVLSVVDVFVLYIKSGKL